MKKTKKELKFLLMCLSTILTTGCAKSDCEITEDHVHLYTKDGYVKYVQSEKLNDWGYQWNEEYHYLNRKDMELQQFLDKNDLLVIEDNSERIQKEMLRNQDYMEYQYTYWDYVPHREYDDEKDEWETDYRWEKKKDWTKDKNHENLTGEERLCHYRYQACKMVKNKKGKMVLEKSEYVDDLFEIQEEYPYIKDNYGTIFYLKPELELNQIDDLQKLVLKP